MKNRLNTLFFGLCFLGAVIGETYCLLYLKGDLFSTIGIGFVVLITGYLFMDSIRSNIKKSMDRAKQYAEGVLEEGTKKWDERYTEMLNLQKATYSVTKKNSTLITEQIQELLLRLETLENNQIKELQRVAMIQKKSLEGQKNALNLDIQYNKENTKLLIDAIKEEEKNSDLKIKLTRILELLEENNQLLRTGNVKNASKLLHNEEEPEALDFENTDKLHDIKITPLYEDPNKNLSTDEIAALFASAVK